MTTTVASGTHAPVVATAPAAAIALTGPINQAGPAVVYPLVAAQPAASQQAVDLRLVGPLLGVRRRASQPATELPTVSPQASDLHVRSARKAANALNAVPVLTAVPDLNAGHAQSAVAGAIGPELLAQAARLDRVVLETPVDETLMDETPVRAGERVPEKGALTPGESANPN